jgi:hypothetical protein
MKQKLLNKAVNIIFILLFCIGITNAQTYKIVDTDQTTFFDTVTVIPPPIVGDPYYGQDAQYSGYQPSYTNNGDGTVTDNVTGLMWQQTFDHNGDGLINVADKLTYAQILAMVDTVTTGGYTDWRLPTIKEQYSLILFSGRDISGYQGSTSGLIPFIDNDIFEFNYGDTTAGERLIDVQCATTNIYVGSAIEMVFGVNFADGRIKGYGTDFMGQPKKFNYLLVRGNTDYGINDFTDNGNGTITDNATGLMWTKEDNGEGVIWEDAISYAENSEFAGYTDWRLPNAKELQSIIDYTRSPSTTNSAAIDPLFDCTGITNEAGESDYPFYWSSTTHANMNEGHEGGWGAYVCFGRGMGYDQMAPQPAWIDVHGAGAQRSDPKNGDPANFPYGHGPQGDAVRIYNFVRLVRGGLVSDVNENKTSLPDQFKLEQNYPNPFNPTTQIVVSIPESGTYTLKVYDVLGKEVATLLNDNITAGAHTFNFDASNLTSGIYFYTFSGNNFSQTKKMMLIK